MPNDGSKLIFDYQRSADQYRAIFSNICPDMCQLTQASRKQCAPGKYCSYFSTKIHVVGTQNNSYIEVVLLSIQTHVLIEG